MSIDRISIETGANTSTVYEVDGNVKFYILRLEAAVLSGDTHILSEFYPARFGVDRIHGLVCRPPTLKAIRGMIECGLEPESLMNLTGSELALARRLWLSHTYAQARTTCGRCERDISASIASRVCDRCRSLERRFP